ncbi:hypothetical protein FB639_001886, partial [Coemansia asiatica]
RGADQPRGLYGRRWACRCTPACGKARVFSRGHRCRPGHGRGRRPGLDPGGLGRGRLGAAAGACQAVPAQYPGPHAERWRRAGRVAVCCVLRALGVLPARHGDSFARGPGTRSYRGRRRGSAARGGDARELCGVPRGRCSLCAQDRGRFLGAAFCMCRRPRAVLPAVPGAEPSGDRDAVPDHSADARARYCQRGQRAGAAVQGCCGKEPRAVRRDPTVRHDGRRVRRDHAPDGGKAQWQAM